MMKNVYAIMGFTCVDCAYFEPEREDGAGMCLLSPSFEKLHASDEVCSAFTQRGCENETEKSATSNLQKRYMANGVKGWHNPYAR